MAASTYFDTETAAEAPRPSEDELFEVLANRRRRYVIDVLTEDQERHDIGTLSTQIAARENEIDVAAVSSEERKRVYTALQQSHLPKLDAAELVDFDKQRGTVAPQPGLDEANRYLRKMRQPELPWSGLYLALATVSTLVVLAVWNGLWPFTLLEPLGWTVAIVVAFGATAALHRSLLTSTTCVW